jgi:hypothetical protein
MSTFDLSVGNFLSYKLNNSKLSLGLYYRIGLGLVTYEKYYNNYYYQLSDNVVAFRKHFGFNIQYGKLITNLGFEWGRTFDATISENNEDYYNYSNRDSNREFHNENIPTGMFNLSIGLIF